MMNHRAEPWHIVGILGFTQIVSWGAVFYGITILAPGIEGELGWRPELVFGAFSWSLLVAGLASTPVGMLIDRFGGRLVMTTGSALAGAGMIALGMMQSVVQYFAAWTVLGIAMAMVLYEAAFATINREFSQQARKGISLVTLAGGLASTVFWPLTLKLDLQIGWRATYIAYGLAQIALCLPLHAMLGATPARHVRAASARAIRSHTLGEALRHPAFWALAFAFAANSFVFSALAVHLIPTFERLGHTAATAVLVSTFIGPMQVIGRMGEMALASRITPHTVGKAIFAMLPCAFLALVLFGHHVLAIAGFCMLYGLSNGILTIVRGTLPQALFGRDNYGAIAGAMAGPALAAKAAGPLAAAMLIGGGASPRQLLGTMLVLSVLSLLCYLGALRVPRGGPDNVNVSESAH
jgi:MFS family permease